MIKGFARLSALFFVKCLPCMEQSTYKRMHFSETKHSCRQRKRSKCNKCCWWFIVFNPGTENTCHSGKYHCTAGLLFDWFGFSSFHMYLQMTTHFLVWSYPIKFQVLKKTNQPYSDPSPTMIVLCLRAVSYEDRSSQGACLTKPHKKVLS